ncbi:HAD family hydrolase [Methanococcoides methylutens]|uniref:HAD family hydrolase n=1 Tax=Methanococcoides methylutens TaxID=2226 RepID=A0A099T321_METMT|nr:HAD family phosphatase [Methanococcoides methylutens]KGK98596.1 HAD family hydrolase [Methanococcoides methylutens]
MLNSLIFDADGVLMDSMPCHADAWVHTFSEVGIDIVRQDIYDIEGSNHVGVIKLIFKKAGREADPEIIEKLRVRKRELFLKKKNIDPFDGMYNLLKKLKNDFHLAVVSGSDRPIVDSMINEFYPDIFEVTISGADVNNGKPDPEPYLKAMEILKVKKENCLVIENAPLGVDSAKNAGIYCVAVPTYVDAEKLKRADQIIQDHKQLIEFLSDIESPR